MKFSASRPDAEASASALWRLQNDLLTLAEIKLGPRDGSKKIYQPTFGPDGPFLINMPTLDGAFAQLSLSAAVFWPTAVYELAHETVHLLNPTVGCTNWLEEGIAVAFSIFALEQHNLPIQLPKLATCREALALVQALPGGPFPTAQRAREASGALNSVQYKDLACIVPQHDEASLRKLTTQCIPR